MQGYPLKSWLLRLHYVPSRVSPLWIVLLVLFRPHLLYILNLQKSLPVLNIYLTLMFFVTCCIAYQVSKSSIHIILGKWQLLTKISFLFPRKHRLNFFSYSSANNLLIIYFILDIFSTYLIPNNKYLESGIPRWIMICNYTFCCDDVFS